MQNTDTLRVRRARQILSAELSLYDQLSNKPKLRYIRPESRHSIEKRNIGPEVGYVCGHGVSLCDPCEMCKRDEEGCKEYRVALVARLRELVSQVK
jgi:hypothetical protein